MSHSTLVESVPIIDVRALKATQRELRQQGINCYLLENAIPRMFFKDQLQRQMGQSSEVCEYVLRLENSRYDVGFLKQEDGSYLPVFDAYQGDIARVLGCDPSTVIPLDSQADTNMACTISKLLLSYVKHATVNKAASLGHAVESAEYDKAGELQIWLRT